MSDIVTLNGYKIKDEKAVRSYESIAQMKADTKLKEGYHVKTKGYYEANDGGHGEYVIVNDDTLVDDGGSIHVLSNGLRAKLIVNDDINIKQFGSKPINSIESYTNTIDTPLQNAINYIMNKVLIDDQGYNFNIIIPSGKYVLETAVELSPSVHLVPNGKVLLYTNNKTNEPKTMIAITKDEREQYITDYKNKFFNPVIGSNKGIIQFVNIGENDDTCISIGGIHDSSRAEITGLECVQIQNYGVGIEFKLKNVYMNIFKKVIVGNCTEGLRFTGNGFNSGENITFNNCEISICNCAVNFNNIVTNLKFNDCSFDGNGCVFYQNCNLNSEIILNNCWIEAIGYHMAYKEPINFNNKRGLIYIERIEGNTIRDYQKTKYVLNSCRYTDSSSIHEGCELPYLFYGNSLVLFLNDFHYSTWENYCNTTPQYLCDSTVREIYYKNYIHAPYGCYPFINKNLINCPNFFGTATGTISTSVDTAISRDFKIKSIENVSSLEIVENNGIKSLKITRDDLTQASELKIVTKNKFNSFNSKFMGRIYFKDDNNSMNGIRGEFRCYYYDDYNNDLSIASYCEYKNDKYKQLSNNFFYPTYIQHIDNSNLYTFCKQAKFEFTIKMTSDSDDVVYITNPEVIDLIGNSVVVGG